MENITIQGDFIRLDAALKFANLVSSGGEAKLRIQAGEVLVNGEVCKMRGKKLHISDTMTLDGQTVTIAFND